MKKQFLFILCSLVFINVFSQKNDKLGKKDQIIAEQFKTEYKRKNYKKFDGNISVKADQVQFGDKIIYYDKNDKTIISILQNGLIYPQLLTEYQINKFESENNDRTQKRFVRLQKNWKNAFEVDKIKLSDLSELASLNPNTEVKRFKISSKDDKIPGSIVYIFELTSKNATKDTSIEEFIKNSKLTYLKQVSFD